MEESRSKRSGKESRKDASAWGTRRKIKREEEREREESKRL